MQLQLSPLPAFYLLGDCPLFQLSYPYTLLDSLIHIISPCCLRVLALVVLAPSLRISCPSIAMSCSTASSRPSKLGPLDLPSSFSLCLAHAFFSLVMVFSYRYPLTVPTIDAKINHINYTDNRYKKLLREFNLKN